MKKESSVKVMYINKNGEFFIQLRPNGTYSIRNKTREVCVESYDYNIVGKLIKETQTGILLKDWRIENR